MACELPWLDELSRPKKAIRLPSVLNKQEVTLLLSSMSGIHLFMAKLLYGAGMRLMELLNLRIKDLDLITKQITIHTGKGKKRPHDDAPRIPSS